ncbi:potassium transporter 5-like isoform X1 [Vicia villosa]|uniref:potassium transporter 5-like isoform X1 n=1 Tax=Vicia villosa TaxID=3911 RepID=UPI00273C3255|nr:potassium transporter 5-like isoform X1 [Vicia villosa]
MNANHHSKMGWSVTLSLAFQSIGIVYGDIGTSPLYVYASTFTDGIKNRDDILGVLSLIIYTIVLIPMLKYVFMVLWARDNGNGGAFALYSLICRHIKVSLAPNQQPEDMELSNYKLEIPSYKEKRANKIKQKIEHSHVARIILLLLAIIEDGILTSSISVLSAVSEISSSHC